MLPFGDSMLVWSLATIAPAFVGLVLVILVGGLLSQRLVAAFALGIFFWFFIDTIQGSSNLLVNQGFTGGFAQVAAVLLFALGLLLFAADRGLFMTVGSGITLLVPLLAAFALGIHGLGEGSAFGSTAAQTSSSSLLGAFGGTSAGIAYALHKALEPMMAGALYVAYSKDSPKSLGGTARDIIALTLVFALPSILGAATGYYLAYDATYLFALGAGTSVYVAFRLARQVFLESTTERKESLKVSLAVLVGFILIYVAALLHS